MDVQQGKDFGRVYTFFMYDTNKIFLFLNFWQNFDFGPVVTAASNIVAYTFLFTFKMNSMNNDGQKHFDTN